MEGRIEGRCRPSRRKTSWLKNLRDWFATDFVSLFRSAGSELGGTARLKDQELKIFMFAIFGENLEPKPEELLHSLTESHST